MFKKEQLEDASNHRREDSIDVHKIMTLMSHDDPLLYGSSNSKDATASLMGSNDMASTSIPIDEADEVQEIGIASNIIVSIPNELREEELNKGIVMNDHNIGNEGNTTSVGVDSIMEELDPKTKPESVKRKRSTKKRSRGSDAQSESVENNSNRKRERLHSENLEEVEIDSPYGSRASDRENEKMANDDMDDMCPSNEAFWMEKLEELREFYRQHNTSPSYLHNSQLYSWVHRQKFLYRKGKLTEQRLSMLSEAGVTFDYHWDEMFHQLKLYKGDSKELAFGPQTDQKLSYWVWTQIYNWRNGKLTADRVKKLEDLGLTQNMEGGVKPPKYTSKKKRKKESPPLEEKLEQDKTEKGKKSEANWVTMYKKLKAYNNENKSVVVPMKYDKKLSLWVRTQRKSWREGRLLDWKKKKLEKLKVSPNFELSSKSHPIDSREEQDIEPDESQDAEETEAEAQGSIELNTMANFASVAPIISESGPSLLPVDPAIQQHSLLVQSSELEASQLPMTETEIQSAQNNVQHDTNIDEFAYLGQAMEASS